MSFTNILLLLAFAAAWILARWLIDDGHPGFALAIMTLAGMMLALPLKFRVSVEMRDWQDPKDEKSAPAPEPDAPFPPDQDGQTSLAIVVVRQPRPPETPGMN